MPARCHLWFREIEKKYKTFRWVEFKLMVFYSRSWPVVDVKGSVSYLSEKPSPLLEHGILSHDYWAWVLLLSYTGCVRSHPLLNQYILIPKVKGTFILTHNKDFRTKSWFINFVVWEAQVFCTFILQTIYCIFSFHFIWCQWKGSSWYDWTRMKLSD